MQKFGHFYLRYRGDYTLEVHFLAQGRVDAILLLYNGEAIFIDSGFRSNGLNCIAYMKKLGITKLHFYIGSHSHRNHIGGAAPIIKEFKPDMIYIPHVGVKNAIIKYAKKGTERTATESANYIILRPDDSFDWQDLKFNCLGPFKIRKCPGSALAENYNSLILRVDRGTRRMLLLTGDTSGTILSQIAKKIKHLLNAEVLKQPHHNSTLNSSVLSLISPDIVVVCNPSPPAKSYINRIKSLKSRLFVAGSKKNSNGNVILTDDGIGWIAKTEK